MIRITTALVIGGIFIGGVVIGAGVTVWYITKGIRKAFK
jgi:hypothetical protein